MKLEAYLAEAHVSAGQALAIQRRYAEAASAFDRAIELDPTLFDAYYLYGRVLFESEDMRRRLNSLRKRKVCGRKITNRVP